MLLDFIEAICNEMVKECIKDIVEGCGLVGNFL